MLNRPHFTVPLLAVFLLALPAPYAHAGLFITGGAVFEYDSTTGAPAGTGIFVPAGSAGLTGPIGLTFGPNGNLFVADQTRSRVLEFNGTTGAPVGGGVFVLPNSAGLIRPTR